jgi:anaerobic selenocysteine-containing dehydrogenase
LGETADRLDNIRKTDGARSVAFGVGMPKGLEHFVLIRLANLFGSPNVVASQDVCHAPREIAGLHTCGFYPVVDFHHKSRLVILWASNITATNEEGEICSLLLEQVKNGTELIVVDPQRTDLADKADLWLPVRPGADHALALGFLHVIIEEALYDKGFVEKWTEGFGELAEHVTAYSPEKVEEITWAPSEKIREAARKYALANPAAIQWGNPIEHHCSTFDVTRALICLMAITGNLDIPGGNVQAHDPKIMGLGKFVRADLIPNKRKTMLGAFHGVIPRMMTVPPSFLKQAVLEQTPYPIKGLYMMCGNPMLSWADSRQTREALEKLEFMAVADIFMTPTASMADIVLPAATQFEFNDIGHYGIGHGYILARPKVVDPPEECRPDMEIMNELGKRLSPPGLWHDDYEEFLTDVLRPSGLTYKEFSEKGFLKGPDDFGSYQKDGFRTPSGKVELVLSTAEKFRLPALPAYSGPPVADDPDYPLVLTSSKSPFFLHSSYRWLEPLRKRSPEPVAIIHPDTAVKYEVGDGDEISIETVHGKILHRARLSERIIPGVVSGEHGWWFPEEGQAAFFGWERSNFNMLTSVKGLGKEFGTPNIKGIPCRIRSI